MINILKSFNKGKEVKVHIVFDKENTSDLDRAYLLIRIRNNEDKRWKIIYRSKMNCLQLAQYKDYIYDKGIKRITKDRIVLNRNSEEYERFISFLVENKLMKAIDSFKESSRIATAKYLQVSNKSASI